MHVSWCSECSLLLVHVYRLAFAGKDNFKGMGGYEDAGEESCCSLQAIDGGGPACSISMIPNAHLQNNSFHLTLH